MRQQVFDMPTNCKQTESARTWAELQVSGPMIARKTGIERWARLMSDVSHPKHRRTSLTRVPRNNSVPRRLPAPQPQVPHRASARRKPARQPSMRAIKRNPARPCRLRCRCPLACPCSCLFRSCCDLGSCCDLVTLQDRSSLSDLGPIGPKKS
jgi:hypothetical protein